MATKTDNSPEVLFSTADDPTSAQRVSRQARVGRLRKIRAGIYTPNLEGPLDAIVARNWRSIAGHLFPGAVIGYRSAAKGSPDDGKLVLVHGDRAKRIKLPGLELVVVPGAAAVTDGAALDVAYPPLFLASEPRRMLENLATSRGSAERALGQEAVESELAKIFTLRGEQRLNALRDHARELAPRLGLELEFNKLNAIVGALLGTHAAKKLQARDALARAAGRPYDPDRAQLFDVLFAALAHKTARAFARPRAPPRAIESFAGWSRRTSRTISRGPHSLSTRPRTSSFTAASSSGGLRTHTTSSVPFAQSRLRLGARARRPMPKDFWRG